jgi:hypothetical protein
MCVIERVRGTDPDRFICSTDFTAVVYFLSMLDGGTEWPNYATVYCSSAPTLPYIYRDSASIFFYVFVTGDRRTPPPRLMARINHE